MSGWKVGDTEPDLSGIALDAATGVDLTGATLNVHIRKPDATVINRPVTADDQTLNPGGWSMPWQTGDLDTAGRYAVELEVTWSAGRVQTFPGDGNASFTVTAQLA